MGYSSLMTCDVFASALNLGQLNELAKDYFTKSKVHVYQFTHEYTDRGKKYYLPDSAGDSMANNPDTDSLAIFIAGVTSDQTSMYFFGEDGCFWGYMIYPGRVNVLQLKEGPCIYGHEDKQAVAEGEP